MLVSAVTGEGIPELLAADRAHADRASARRSPSSSAPDQLGAAPWLYENTEVLERNDDPETGTARLKVRIAEKRMAPFQEWAQRRAA